MSTLKRTLELGLWGFGAATPLWALFVVMYGASSWWVSDGLGRVLGSVHGEPLGASGMSELLIEGLVQMALWGLFEPAFVITGAVGVVVVAGREGMGLRLLSRALMALPVGVFLATLTVLVWQLIIPGLACEVIGCYVVISMVVAHDGQRVRSAFQPWIRHPIMSGGLLLATGVANVLAATLLPLALSGVDGTLNLFMGDAKALPTWSLVTMDVSGAIVCVLSSCLFAALLIHCDPPQDPSRNAVRPSRSATRTAPQAL